MIMIEFKYWKRYSRVYEILRLSVCVIKGTGSFLFYNLTAIPQSVCSL